MSSHSSSPSSLNLSSHSSSPSSLNLEDKNTTMDLVQQSEHLCYVRCNFCNTVLAVIILLINLGYIYAELSNTFFHSFFFIKRDLIWKAVGIDSLEKPILKQCLCIIIYMFEYVIMFCVILFVIKKKRLEFHARGCWILWRWNVGIAATSPFWALGRRRLLLFLPSFNLNLLIINLAFRWWSLW